MLYRPFGKIGWNVSAIGMGTWNIGNQWGELDEATSWGTVRAAYDSGINLFDTADAYGIPHGLSEDRLGRALAGLRHRVYVVSKAGNSNPVAIPGAKNPEQATANARAGEKTLSADEASKLLAAMETGA